ncbi:MAG: methyltransferase domain-containing protein [Nocardioidaceae bacterium]|nr:methyltransferase domain-containing protein [Nocardioidaceae bacterium]
MTIEPDTKDWTWVLDAPCPECGFDARVFTDADLAPTVEANARGWRVALAAPDTRQRPTSTTWSPLEYACHVRDVHRVFAERVRLMLAENDPAFANWDQDVTAAEDRYDLQEPAVVSGELAEAAQVMADLLRSVAGPQWSRTGRRSNGSFFTVDSIGRYYLHDIVHHLHDVGFDARSVTAAAYDADAPGYAAATSVASDSLRGAAARFAAALAEGRRVLEIGTGSGRDALLLETAGVSVRRTDVTPGFVAVLREAGHDADLLDPLVDDLADPADPDRPYDGVWANASLLHVDRSRLLLLLERLAAVTRAGGALWLSVKEGDGEAWSTHGTVSAARLFTFWREAPLSAVLDRAGWRVLDVAHAHGASRDELWLNILAARR